MSYTPYYDPTGWVDDPSTDSPITAAALNYIEAGIEAAASVADAAIPKTISGVATDKVPVYNGSAWVAQKIANAQVDAAAAIAYSKLNLTGSIVNADLALVWSNFTPGVSGLTSITTSVARYMVLGKLVIIQFKFTGTSNAASFGFSLPIALGNNAISSSTQLTGPWTDNGTTLSSPSRIRLTPGSAVAALDKTMNAGDGWTASGTKSAGMFFFAYEID